MLLDCKEFKGELKAGMSESVSMVSGESPLDVRGIGLEYMDLREYRFGDDVRWVDWRVSARDPNGNLFVKVYRVERRVKVELAVDLTASMGFKEKPLTLARSLGIVLGVADKLGDLVRPMTFSDEVKVFPLMSGRKASYVLMREACSGFRGDLTLEEVVKRFRGGRSIAFTDPSQPLLGVKRARSAGASLFIVSSRGEIGWDLGREEAHSMVWDVETSRSSFLNLHDFMTAVRAHLASLTSLIRRRGLIVTKDLVRWSPMSLALSYVRWTRGGVRS